MSCVIDPALPGADLIEAGVKDLLEQRESIAALVVAIGAPPLRRLGVVLPDALPPHPEHQLYASSRETTQTLHTPDTIPLSED